MFGGAVPSMAESVHETKVACIIKSTVPSS